MTGASKLHSLAYQRLFEATASLRKGAFFETLTPETPSCACCDRSWCEVEAPFQAVRYHYGKNGETEYVCLTCYTPRIPSEEMLGLERFNVTGKTRTPIYGKLGMLVGSGGIITPRSELYLTLPPKLFEKYREGEFGQQGRLSTQKSLVRLISLLSQGALDPLVDGFVYIENWGRKVDVLMRQLTPTYSLHEVWCNSDRGVRVMNLHAMLLTAEQLHQQGLHKKAGSIVFWKPILDAAEGHRDDKAFEKWLAKVPEPAALMQSLPLDPYDRLQLPTVLGVIMDFLDDLLPYCHPKPFPALAQQTPSAPQQGALF
ncbi:hypothetical protein HLB35_15505 [Halomonas sp. TBZ9]|uniref:Uncharacterized protein n=1 Tax=Vreelandella azerica TaxID=2732867 RepID=A0A7Y3U231_9GAMM|nr:hypothetical protein [Halomonas azerica]NOG32809.1 hypothetical protein [Halomonas azerica]